MRLASVFECLADECEDFFLGGVVVLVAHLGTDDVGEFLVVGGEGIGHDGGGLLLLVDFAAVGDDGEVEQVADIERYVRAIYGGTCINSKIC